jgi:rare lipoprotein A
VNLAVTVALVPALFSSHAGSPKAPVVVSAGATLETLPVVATAVPGSAHVVVLGPNDIAAEAATTTTTAAPPPTAVLHQRTTPATVKRVAKPAVRPRAVATTTTTTAAPRPKAAPSPAPKARPAPTTAPAAAGDESGKASWYDHEAGVCAHKTLPFGTVVTVTNVANGRSVRCTVGDRGPYVDGWVIDLNPREFDQLAPRSAGVISVRLTW